MFGMLVGEGGCRLRRSEIYFCKQHWYFFVLDDHELKDVKALEASSN